MGFGLRTQYLGLRLGLQVDLYQTRYNIITLEEFCVKTREGFYGVKQFGGQ